MPQKQNILKVFLIAVLCLASLGVAGEGKAALLFDGSFTGPESFTGAYDSSFQNWPNSIICFDNQLSTVLAPGGRPGYAAQWIVQPGQTCAGNDHSQLKWTSGRNGYPSIPNPPTTNEYWVGWSQMLDSSWQPVGAGNWHNFGFAGVNVNYQYYSTGTRSMRTELGSTDRKVILRVNQHQIGGVEQGVSENILADHAKGVWYDWMYHVKLTDTNDGFFEVWLRKPTDADYVKIFSKYDFPTQEVVLGYYKYEAGCGNRCSPPAHCYNGVQDGGGNGFKLRRAMSALRSSRCFLSNILCRMDLQCVRLED